MSIRNAFYERFEQRKELLKQIEIKKYNCKHLEVEKKNDLCVTADPHTLVCARNALGFACALETQLCDLHTQHGTHT